MCGSEVMSWATEVAKGKGGPSGTCLERGGISFELLEV